VPLDSLEGYIKELPFVARFHREAHKFRWVGCALRTVEQRELLLRYKVATNSSA